MRLLVMVGLLLGLLPARFVFAAPPKWHTEWEKRLNGYHLLNRRDRQAEGGAGAETCVVRDRKGRTVFAIHAIHRVSFEKVFYPLDRKTPCVYVSTWSGGAHAGYVHYLYALGKSPRCLLVYDQQDGGGPDDFRFCALNHEGSLEILATYNGLRYYNRSAYSLTPAVPIVFTWHNGRYQDRTASFPARIRTLQRITEQQLKETVTARNLESRDKILFALAIAWYAQDVLIEKPATARHKLLALIPKSMHREMAKHWKPIERILAKRFRRYAYPPPYTTDFDARARPLRR